MQPRARRLAPVVAGTAITILFTGVLLGGSLGVGQLLYRDFVSVPEPSLTARTWGFDDVAPRAVPLDAVTALLAAVVPTWVQQQVMLVATLLLAGVGTAVLLRGRGTVAAAVGAGIASWSPYAAERLLLGQPPTLLAWSMIPWIVLAGRSGRSLRARLGWTALAALPAALTPFGGVLAAVAALGAAFTRRAPVREHVALAGVAGIWCLPWLVPALGGRIDAGDGDGAAAFAVALDGPGVVLDVLDVLGGGGVWAVGAALGSREQVWALVATVGLLVLALAGLSGVAARDRIALAALAFGLPTVVIALATPPGLAVWGWAQSVPGVALFRDTHRLLGLSWFAVAILAGLGAAAVSRWLRSAVHPAASTGLVLVVFAACVLSSPDAPGRLRAAYDPVSFPASFEEAVRAAGDERTLVLPWQPMRRVPWAGDQPFLDPTALALTGPVVVARDLVVQRDGLTIRVGSADPPEAEAWTRGAVDPTALHRLGIGRVIVWQGTPGTGFVPQPGLEEVFRSPEFEVWRVTGAESG